MVRMPGARAVMLGLGLGLAMTAGCLATPEHRCASDTDCAGGVCVSPPSACAFPDGTCAGGLRFGEGAGAQASACVTPPVDAAEIDARPIDGPPPFDEDGDGVGDEVDNCPHVANPQQEDVGEMAAGPPDGVGDACDPEPARAGNRLVLFEGWHAAPSGWTASGIVSVEDDTLRLSGNAQLTTMGTVPRNAQITIHAHATGAFEAVTPVVGTGATMTNPGLTLTQTDALPSRLRLAYNGTNANDTASAPITGTTGFTMTLTSSRTSWNGVLAIEGGATYNVRRFALQVFNDGRVSLGGGGGATYAIDSVAVIALVDQ